MVALALLPILLGLLPVGCVKPPTAETQTESADEDRNELNPAEMTSFTIYVTAGGFTKEAIKGRIAYLYQDRNIAHIRNIHADFFTTASKEKDTLDAPEGYLYLKTLEGDQALTSGDPFYERIGRKEANIDLWTNESFRRTGLPERNVVRYRRDMDLLGRPLNKIIYRRADGIRVESLRVYRQNSPDGAPMLFATGALKVYWPQPKKKSATLITGGMFAFDDELTTFNVYGVQDESPQMSSVQLESGGTRGSN